MLVIIVFIAEESKPNLVDLLSRCELMLIPSVLFVLLKFIFIIISIIIIFSYSIANL